MRIFLSWALWWLGDRVSKIDNHLPFFTLYPIYNWLMLTSSDLQGCRGGGPWSPIELHGGVTFIDPIDL